MFTWVLFILLVKYQNKRKLMHPQYNEVWWLKKKKTKIQHEESLKSIRIFFHCRIVRFPYVQSLHDTTRTRTWHLLSKPYVTTKTKHGLYYVHISSENCKRLQIFYMNCPQNNIFFLRKKSLFLIWFVLRELFL